MAGKTVVMVLDTDDAARGEIKMLSEQHEAARLVEDLLESGIELERIRVFDALELSLKVAHRPVVSLATDTGEEISSAAPDFLGDAEPGTPAFAHSIEDESEGDPVTAEPLVRNGVRFSSLFKSDEV